MPFRRTLNSSSHRPQFHLPLSALLLRLLHDLLHDLLLLDQERAGDAVLDAVGAARATVGTLDGLLGSGDVGVFAGAQGWDLYIESELAMLSMILHGPLPSPAVLGARRSMSGEKPSYQCTYTREFRAAITAFGRSASLLDVQVSELAAGGFADADLVRLGVVGLTATVGESGGRHRGGVWRCCRGVA